jgi:guanylate kinase
MVETEIKRKGLMFVISSPSGAGKSTLARLLLEKDDNLEMSISMTTRSKRPSEKDGIDYYFVSKDEFADKVESNAMLECAEVFGNHYGTPEEHVRKNLEAGRDVLFDIDWQGTEQLNKSCRDDIVSIFILPPSMKELDSRLRSRGQDSDEVIEQRMSKAIDEISHWNSYDYVVINDDLEKSLEKVYAILMAERHKRSRQHGLSGFIQNLEN